MYIHVLYTSLSYSDQSHGVRVAAEISKRDRWSATGVEKNTLMSSREVASHINQGCTNKNLSTSPRSRYSFNRNHQDTWILTTWRTTHHFFKENFGTHLAAHHCEPTMNFFLPLHCVSPRCLCPLSVFHQAPGGVSPANFLQIFRGIWGKRRSWSFGDKKLDQLETTPWEKKQPWSFLEALVNYHSPTPPPPLRLRLPAPGQTAKLKDSRFGNPPIFPVWDPQPVAVQQDLNRATPQQIKASKDRKDCHSTHFPPITTGFSPWIPQESAWIPHESSHESHSSSSSSSESYSSPPMSPKFMSPKPGIFRATEFRGWGCWLPKCPTKSKQKYRKGSAPSKFHALLFPSSSSSESCHLFQSTLRSGLHKDVRCRCIESPTECSCYRGHQNKHIVM